MDIFWYLKFKLATWYLNQKRSFSTCSVTYLRETWKTWGKLTSPSLSKMPMIYGRIIRDSRLVLEWLMGHARSSVQFKLRLKPIRIRLPIWIYSIRCYGYWYERCRWEV